MVIFVHLGNLYHLKTFYCKDHETTQNLIDNLTQQISTNLTQNIGNLHFFSNIVHTSQATYNTNITITYNYSSSFYYYYQTF